MLRGFEGRVAVVTGAASGIGLALSHALAARGAHLALWDVDPAVSRVASQLSTTSRVTSHVVDVADEGAVRHASRSVLREHGQVHLLINNAGVAVAGPFEAVPAGDLHWLFGVNFWGVVHTCRALLPHLREQPEAHIVNVCSSFAWLGFPGKAAYAASKAAVRAFSESLRAELVHTAVGLTLLFPGPVATNIVARGRATSATQRAAEAQLLAARGLDPARVARRCLRGVERNAARVVIGLDYRLLDGAVRMAPSWALAAVTRMARRLPFVDPAPALPPSSNEPRAPADP